MVAPPLVEPYWRAGTELVEHLSASGFPFSGAYWFLNAEYDRWEFVIVSSLPDEIGIREALLRLLRLFPKDSLIEFEDTDLLSPHNKIAAALQRYSGGGPKGLPKRIARAVVDGQFIDDALVYRVEG